MGKVIARIKLTNYSDLVLQRLKLTKRRPRQVEVEMTEEFRVVS